MASAHLENNKFIILNNDKTPKHSLDEHKTFDEVKNLDSLAILVDEPYVMIDIDDAFEYLTLKKIIKAENIKCRIMKTTRGGHFWFKSIEPMKNLVHANTPITLNVDVRSHGKKSLAKVKQDGEWREWEVWVDEVDDIPFWLRPVSHKYHFMNSKEGDGRNSDLFSYIITLTNAGITKEQTKHVYQLINTHLFADKLPSEELNTILRDEAFDKIKPAFFDKRRFMHDVFSKYFRNDNKVYVKNGRLFMYDEGYYSDNTKVIEKRMIQYIPELSKMQRREVMDYLKLIANDPINTSMYHVVCKNGLVDIRDCSVGKYTSEIFLANKINASYIPTAYSVDVDRTLDKISCNDKELRMLIEEMIGYCLIQTAKFQKAFILFGDGSNGKSTLLDVVIALLGDNNVSSLSLKELNHNFKLSEITSKMANIGDDISDEYLTDSSIFKKLVTGEEITVDKKNEQPYKIRNYAKMIFAANNMPNTMDKSNGMIRRLSIIPFNAVFSKNDPDYDPFIIDKLTSEEGLNYLLKIAVDGIRRVFSNNKFTEPKAVESMVSEYEKENNNVLQFIDKVEIANRDGSSVYNDYKFWCVENGVMSYKIRKFNSEIKTHLHLELVIEKFEGRTAQVWRKK